MKSLLVGLFGLLFTAISVAAQTCPVNTSPPSISGTPQVGQSLSVSPGTWTNSPITLFHQWFRNTNPPTAIPGETSTTHIASSSDVGFTLSVEEVASNSTGAAQVMSGATAPIQSSGGGGGITSQNLTSGITGGGGTSVTTASISPAPNSVIIAAVGGRNPSGGANVTPTLSGAGLTWTLIGSALDGSGGSRSVVMFYAITGASPGSGALTFSYGSTSEQNFMWSVDQFSGANLSSPIVQQASVTPATGTTSGVTVKLAALASGDASYGFVRQNNGSVAVSPGSGFTQLSNVNNVSTGTGSAETALNLALVSWNWGSVASNTPVGMAIEIAHQ